MPDAELNYHSIEKIQGVLARICLDGVSREEVRDMLAGRQKELVRASSTVSLSGTNAQVEMRQAILLYGLFLKTAHRRFSKRFEEICPETE